MHIVRSRVTQRNHRRRHRRHNRSQASRTLRRPSHRPRHSPNSRRSHNRHSHTPHPSKRRTVPNRSKVGRSKAPFQASFARPIVYIPTLARARIRKGPVTQLPTTNHPLHPRNIHLPIPQLQPIPQAQTQRSTSRRHHRKRRTHNQPTHPIPHRDTHVNNPRLITQQTQALRKRTLPSVNNHHQRTTTAIRNTKHQHKHSHRQTKRPRVTKQRNKKLTIRKRHHQQTIQLRSTRGRPKARPTPTHRANRVSTQPSQRTHRRGPVKPIKQSHNRQPIQGIKAIRSPLPKPVIRTQALRQRKQPPTTRQLRTPQQHPAKSLKPRQAILPRRRNIQRTTQTPIRSQSQPLTQRTRASPKRMQPTTSTSNHQPK